MQDSWPSRQVMVINGFKTIIRLEKQVLREKCEEKAEYLQIPRIQYYKFKNIKKRLARAF